MKALLPLLLALFLLLSGCGSAGSLQQQKEPTSTTQAQQTNNSVETSEASPETSTEPETETAEATAESTDDLDSITPYQFLNLMVGNAAEISFSYTVYSHETKETGTGAFYRVEDQSAAVFTATDMDGKPITVREVETAGTVCYVMEDTKTIKSYLAPAEDFLLNEMMSTTMTAPESSIEDGYTLYKYSLPFEQDAQIILEYGFYMKDGVLRKLTYSVDGFLSKTYEFLEFTQEVVDKKVFECPGDYKTVEFDETYTGEHMPPWWENDGLA